MRISTEQQILLDLLKEDMTAETCLDTALIEAADWPAVVQEACAQTVALQTFNAAGPYKDKIPQDVYQKWFCIATRGMQKNMRVLLAQNELIRLLEEHHCAHVILKGTSSAAYYPRPELRGMGDIDFLIDTDEEEQVRACLAEAGFHTDGKDGDHHALYLRGGIPYEMHFRPGGIPQGNLGCAISDFFANLHADAKQKTVDIAAFRAPSDAHHGMILLLHMIQHMLSGGFGLRHLYDWAAYVQATTKEPFWEEELLPLMQQCGIRFYASVMTAICADHLGITLPEWCEHIEKDQADEVLLDILTGGNFGRKEMDRDRESCIVTMKVSEQEVVSPVRNALRVLHRTTPTLHPIVKKWPILHGVFDLYRGIRYLFRCLKGDRRWFGEMLPNARARQAIYEQLKVFAPDGAEH